MKILFRADSSSNIGTGHIMRDLVLAKKFYDKDNIYFATRNLEGNINQKIVEAGYKNITLLNESIRALNSVIKRLKITLLIIDSYKLGYRFEKAIKHLNPKLKIFVIDDKYHRHYCDVLLNHNIHANRRRYKKLVPKSCTVLCGSQYTLVREEFFKEKDRYYPNENRVLIALGGTDGENLSLRILEILENFNLKRVVITTTANKNLTLLKEYVKNTNIELHINTNQVAKYMQQASLIITTPSVMLNEVYFLNKDFIAIKSADNQKEMIKFLKKNNSDIIEVFEEKRLMTLVEKRFR